MRECKNCLVSKPITDYYKHPKGLDGYNAKCKECAKSSSKARIEKLKNDPNWIEKERERGRDKYHRLGYKDTNKPTQETKRESIQKYKEQFPEKYTAKILSQRVPIEKGYERHHWCYSFQYARDIIPLTVKDHSKLHRHITYDQDYFMYRRSDTMQLLETKEMHIEYINEILNLGLKLSA